LTEAEIIKYCKEGNRNGFKELVDKYAPLLMGICLRYMNNEFDANDVLQESFIRIFKNIGNYKSNGSFEGWISKITVRSALIALRKRKSGIRFLEQVSNNEEKTYEAEIEVNLNEEDILLMIQKLPEHYRIIFNMSVIEGYNHAEIAKLLNIPEGTSRTKLTRARKKLQEIYLKEMDDIELVSISKKR